MIDKLHTAIFSGSTEAITAVIREVYAADVEVHHNNGVFNQDACSVGVAPIIAYFEQWLSTFKVSRIEVETVGIRPPSDGAFEFILCTEIQQVSKEKGGRDRINKSMDIFRVNIASRKVVYTAPFVFM